MRLVVVEFMTLDGVMEAPVFEEHRSGRHGWAMPKDAVSRLGAVSPRRAPAEARATEGPRTRR